MIPLGAPQLRFRRFSAAVGAIRAKLPERGLVDLPFDWSFRSPV